MWCSALLGRFQKIRLHHCATPADLRVSPQRAPRKSFGGVPANKLDHFFPETAFSEKILSAERARRRTPPPRGRRVEAQRAQSASPAGKASEAGFRRLFYKWLDGPVQLLDGLVGRGALRVYDGSVHMVLQNHLAGVLWRLRTAASWMRTSEQSRPSSTIFFTLSRWPMARAKRLETRLICSGLWVWPW